MAVTNTAAFGQAPKTFQGVLTAAKSAPLSSATNAVSMGTPGANGSIITGVTAIPRDTLATDAHIALYYSDDAGTTLYIWAIGLLTSWTFAATTAPTPLYMTNMDGTVISPTNPLYVPYAGGSGRLYGSTSVALANGILIAANGVDL